jgi:preprotein translocase subunit SecD
MISRSLRFNFYLLATLLSVLVLAGCQSDKSATGSDPKPSVTGKRSKKKEATLLRLHLEANPDGTSRTAAVPVYRANPMQIVIDQSAFLDGGNIIGAALVESIGGFAISVQFDSHGAFVLENVSEANKGRRIAVFSQFGETRWLAAPLIARRLSGGVFTFTPDATREESERIVRGLNNVAAEFKKKSRL